MKIKVIYSPKQVADSGSEISPSAIKPQLMANLLHNNPNIEFVEPNPISIEDIKRCHDSTFVDNIISLRECNGFGTFSQSVVDSLPYTNGAMYVAAKIAIETRNPSVALVSGFHHAGYHGFRGFGYFCTFNGLMITATKLIEDDKYNKVAIVDCDMHDGNGTDDILLRLGLKNIININFGKLFTNPKHATNYLKYFDNVEQILNDFKPSIILYESGADVHVNDPFGGVLTEEQMYERDVKMFTIAKKLDIPIAWCLAGGYQIVDGKCDFVLHLHMNTFKACQNVFNVQSF